jgi:hypothetical protein
MPTTDAGDSRQARAFLADCNRRRLGWAGFHRGTRRTALRILATMTEQEAPMTRYEVRTVDADPTTRQTDFHKAPPEPVYYVHDTVKDRPVPLSSSHDRAAADRDCAARNSKA